jgi:hypothetical protein
MIPILMDLIQGYCLGCVDLNYGTWQAMGQHFYSAYEPLLDSNWTAIKPYVVLNPNELLQNPYSFIEAMPVDLHAKANLAITKLTAPRVPS